jgi:hypothetical protein
MVDVKRVFVGGLTPEITVDELKERFQRFCEVLDVQIKKKRNCESMTAKFCLPSSCYYYLVPCWYLFPQNAFIMDTERWFLIGKWKAIKLYTPNYIQTTQITRK